MVMSGRLQERNLSQVGERMLCERRQQGVQRESKEDACGCPRERRTSGRCLCRINLGENPSVRASYKKPDFEFIVLASFKIFPSVFRTESEEDWYLLPGIDAVHKVLLGVPRVIGSSYVICFRKHQSCLFHVSKVMRSNCGLAYVSLFSFCFMPLLVTLF